MDLNKFINASLSAREADVAVPALADFFDDGEKPVWRVRGLTAAELARSREATDKGESIKKLVEAMAGDGDKAEAIRESLGLSSEEVPTDVSRRIEMLVAGSVKPEIPEEQRDVAVKMAENFPVTFYELTNKVQELTGDGAELGKRKRSGRTKASEQH